MSEVQAEAEKAMTELKNEAERAIASKDAEIDALKSELEQVKDRAEQSEGTVQELERRLTSLTETKKREWRTEVVDPEIVSEDPPPSVRDVFKQGRAQATLADLERQAQAELARMGASGAKKFFGLK